MKLKTTTFKHYPIGSTIWYVKYRTKKLPNCKYCGTERTIDIPYPKAFKIEYLTYFSNHKKENNYVRYFNKNIMEFIDIPGHKQIFITKKDCEKYIKNIKDK